MSHKIAACIWYDGAAEEAATFYAATFPARVDAAHRSTADCPGGKAGDVLTVAFTVCGWCQDRWGLSWQIAPLDGCNGQSRQSRRQARDGGDDDDAQDRHRRDQTGGRGRLTRHSSSIQRG